MNLTHMIDGHKLKEKRSDIKKIFFYRICGTGMGACACLAREAGFEVAGADMSFAPPMSTYLESQKIPLFDLKELKKEDLQDYDLIIVGNSVPRNSEFAHFVEELGIDFTSFPSFLGEFILKDKEVIGIAGTHGKTTTSFFLTQMLESLGEDPGYFIGGIIEGRSPSKLGQNYFIIESDEYDSAYFKKISKFRLYELNHMILTSLEFDHADIFNSIEDIKNEFSATVPGLSGCIIANDDYEAIHDLQKKYPYKDWSFYGEHTEEGPINFETTNELSKFSLKLGNSFVSFQTNIIGYHNVLNISSCIKILHKLGFNTIELQNSVENLGMVKRRQELRGFHKGATVIDDFAHHPKAISLTIDAIKNKYPTKKIVTVFEPVSATARSSFFQEEFVESLLSSDEVVLAVNPMATTVKNSNNLDATKLVADLNEKGIDSLKLDDLDQLIKHLDNRADEETLFLILSNRTCIGLWESNFAKNL